MSMEKPKALVSGSIARDMLVDHGGDFRRHAQVFAEGQFSLSLLVEGLEERRGGTGANIAYTLALLGETPILLGSAGEEDTDYLTKLSEMGVDTEYIFHSRLPTALFFNSSDEAQNQIGFFYKGAMSDPEADLSLQMWVDGNVFVILSPHDPEKMMEQVSECKQYGLRMFFDIGQQVHNVPTELLEEGVEAAELLIVNASEMNELCRRLNVDAEELKMKIPVVVTTLGKHGAIISGASVAEPIEIGIARPRKVVETTGAGDAWRAGFLYGYIRDWDLKICGQMGAVAASFAIEQKGGQAHRFTKSEFVQRFAATYGEVLPLDE